jgi:TPR repeat protein
MRRTLIIFVVQVVLFFALQIYSAAADTIQLEQQGGAYLVAVRINDAITLNFVLDTGAADVGIPEDVFLTLKRTGTIKESDFIGPGTYVLADGSEQPSERFVLHEVRVGEHVVRNVIANVAPVKGDPLLGQSFLSKLPAWTIDNRQHTLVLNDTAGPVGAQETAPPRSSPALDSNLPTAEIARRARRALAARNYAEAMRWLPLAAAHRDTKAKYNLGVLYRDGLGVAQDYAEAMRWFREAAAQGNTNAQYNIGALYREGLGVVRDYAEAMHWFREAAAQGDAGAKDDIGWLYANGLGVAQDYAEAMRWFREAAAQGNANAGNSIGGLFRDGLGVPQNHAEAMRWFQMAADQGSARAQDNIGLMVAWGEGVRKDCKLAKQWFEKAAAAGNEMARENLRNGANGACRW